MYLAILNKIFFGAKWEKLTFEHLVQNKFLIITAISQSIEGSNDRTIIEGFKIPSQSGEADMWNMFLASISKYYTKDTVNYDKFVTLFELCNKVRSWMDHIKDNDPHFSEDMDNLQALKYKAQKFKLSEEEVFEIKISEIIKSLDVIEKYIKGYDQELIRKDKWYYATKEEMNEIIELKSYLTNQLTLL